MNDNEDELRLQEQSRALDVHRPSGALLVPSYTERRQEFVVVNKNDLEDIREFQGQETFFGAVGLFLLSGAVWLGVGKTLEAVEANVSPWTTTVVVCIVISVFGAFMLGCAYWAATKKHDRIRRIFSESRPISRPA